MDTKRCLRNSIEILSKLHSVRKFLWYNAIVKIVIDTHKDHLSCYEVACHMLCDFWAIKKNDRIQFGEQDKIEDALSFILTYFQLSYTTYDNLYCLLLRNRRSPEVYKTVRNLYKRMAFNFLNLWIGDSFSAEITYDKDMLFQNDAMYCMDSAWPEDDGGLVLNPEWYAEILENANSFLATGVKQFVSFLEEKNAPSSDIKDSLHLIYLSKSSPDHILESDDVWDMELDSVECDQLNDELDDDIIKDGKVLEIRSRDVIEKIKLEVLTGLRLSLIPVLEAQYKDIPDYCMEPSDWGYVIDNLYNRLQGLPPVEVTQEFDVVENFEDDFFEVFEIEDELKRKRKITVKDSSVNCVDINVEEEPFIVTLYELILLEESRAPKVWWVVLLKDIYLNITNQYIYTNQRIDFFEFFVSVCTLMADEDVVYEYLLELGLYLKTYSKTEALKSFEKENLGILKNEAPNFQHIDTELISLFKVQIKEKGSFDNIFLPEDNFMDWHKVYTKISISYDMGSPKIINFFSEIPWKVSDFTPQKLQEILGIRVSTGKLISVRFRVFAKNMFLFKKFFDIEKTREGYFALVPIVALRVQDYLAFIEETL